MVYGECAHTTDFHAKVGSTTISCTGYLGSNLGNETDCPDMIFVTFPSEEMMVYFLRVRHKRFIPYHFHFVIY
jgi:hypothetical protein